MSHISSNRRKPATRRNPAATAAMLVLLLACLGLAACGGSSKSSSTSANAATTTAQGAAGTGTGTGTGANAARPGAARFKAMRECLQKNGITLPKPTPGQRSDRGGPGGFLSGGATGPQLPKGVTRAQYEAALKKCGGGAGGSANRSTGIKSPVFQQALAKFAACLRENGVNVPPPNTSGKGPIFTTKGLNTSSAQFRAAETKCSSALRSAFRRGPKAGAPSSGGATPGGTAPSGHSSG